MRANPINLTKKIFLGKGLSHSSPSLVAALIVERNAVDCLFAIEKKLQGICFILIICKVLAKELASLELPGES